MLMICTPPSKAPDEPEYVEIDFVKGIPVKVNETAYDGVSPIKLLNQIGAKHGVGIADMVENRLVGMKSRGVYETPGGTVLYAAHQELESITLDRDTLQYKQLIAVKFAELVYDEMVTPLRQSLSSLLMKHKNRYRQSTAQAL